MRWKHEADYQCPADNCGECWSVDITSAFGWLLGGQDHSGQSVIARKCPRCGCENIDGEIRSTEDLDYDENMRASVIEGRSDERAER